MTNEMKNKTRKVRNEKTMQFSDELAGDVFAHAFHGFGP
jgi:hypothetical protein